MLTWIMLRHGTGEYLIRSLLVAEGADVRGWSPSTTPLLVLELQELTVQECFGE